MGSVIQRKIQKKLQKLQRIPISLRLLHPAINEPDCGSTQNSPDLEAKEFHKLLQSFTFGAAIIINMFMMREAN
jgi:hypothetical protein